MLSFVNIFLNKKAIFIYKMFLFRYEDLLKLERKLEMGYAIFTARKLMLINRINQMQYRLMQLSQQQMSLADSAAQQERASASRKNLLSNFSNIFQMGMERDRQLQLQKYYEQANSTRVEVPKDVMFNMFQSTNPMANPAIATLNIISQLEEARSGSQLRQVKEMENEIQLQMKSLETQLAAAQAELKSVEETERKNIENSAPKFA